MAKNDLPFPLLNVMDGRDEGHHSCSGAGVLSMTLVR